MALEAAGSLARQYGITWHRQLHHDKRKGSLGGELQALLVCEHSSGYHPRCFEYEVAYYQNLDGLHDGLYSQIDFTTSIDAQNPLEDVLDCHDVNVMVGNDLLRSEAAHAGLNLGCTIPVVSDHFAVGFGGTATCTPWAKGCGELEVIFAANYRYLLTGQERRFISVKGQDWSFYQLIGHADSSYAKPSANVLNTKVDVTPGARFDGLVGLAYTWQDFTFDAGYSLYARESEDVRLRGDSWIDDKYTYAIDGTYINRNDLDTTAAQTPGYISHKMYGGIGYTVATWRHPMQCKVGGFYEWFSVEHTPQNWSVFGGIALSF